MKMKNKSKNRSHRYDINRPGPRHERNYSKYKKCLSMIMLTIIKPHFVIIKLIKIVYLRYIHFRQNYFPIHVQNIHARTCFFRFLRTYFFLLYFTLSYLLLLFYTAQYRQMLRQSKCSF